MSKATQGSQYTIVSGDTLIGLAKQAYGDGKKWRKIWNANKTVLRSGDPNLIFPGEVITIPVDSEIEEIKKDLRGNVLPGKEKDDFTLVISGKEIPVMAGRVLRTMDKAADGWSASISWDPDDKDFQPKIYLPMEIYLGGQLVLTGTLYQLAPETGPNGVILNMGGASLTADIVDSTMKPPYEKSKINLVDKARELVEPMGISVVSELTEDEVFDRVTADSTDTIFSFLSGLATQRGVLISSTAKGELLFWVANTTGIPVGTIQENVPPGRQLKATFDGRKWFNSYTAIAQSPKRTKKTATAKDDNVPKSRFMTFMANDTTAGNVQRAADWRRSKQLTDALAIPFPVDSWYGPNGDLWLENTLVTVVSKTIFVPDGFDFIIRSIEYVFDENGTTAMLNIIPPQTYTGDPIEVPWI